GDTVGARRTCAVGAVGGLLRERRSRRPVRATPRRPGGAAQARRAGGAAGHAASAAGPSRMSHGEPLGLATPKPWVRRAIGVLGVLFLASMVWTAMGPAETQRSAALAAFAGLLLWLLLHQLLQLGAARDALAASQQRFALAVAGSDDGIWDWDLAAQRIYLSAR